MSETRELIVADAGPVAGWLADSHATPTGVRLVLRMTVILSEGKRFVC